MLLDLMSNYLVTTKVPSLIFVHQNLVNTIMCCEKLKLTVFYELT